MKIDEFKRYFQALIDAHRFERLLWTSAWEDQEASDYLNNRGLTKDLFEATKTEVCVYDGVFRYLGKDYRVKKSIVIPLRSPEGDLRGVWIRFIEDKRFFIWLAKDEVSDNTGNPSHTGNLGNSNNQKYWIPGTFDPNEPALVCESIFDALSLAKLTNNFNVCACLGVKPSRDLDNLLAAGSLLALDNDTAGKKSMLDLLTSSDKYGIIVPELSNHKDYNDVLKFNEPFTYKKAYGIQAKVYLRSSV